MKAISGQPSAISLIRRLFEGAGPLIERLESGGPYTSPRDLLERARAILPSLSEKEKIAVINAHPRIGAPPAAVQDRSPISYREQGYDRRAEPEAVLRELERLNDAYEAGFGFRFVVFVNRRSKAEIVPVLQERLRRSRAEEVATALAEILAIAEDRLRRRAS